MRIDLELKVTGAEAEDVGKGFARLNPEDMKTLSAVLGDLIEINGEKKTVARITGSFSESYGKKAIQIDRITRANARVNLGKKATLREISRQTATTVLLTPLAFSYVLPEERDLYQFAFQVIVLGATNREDLLDPTLMRTGRLDYVLQFSIPDERDRLEIFQVHTREKPLASDVDLTELAGLTEGLAGSQIESICRSATMMAISESIQASVKKSSPRLLIVARHFREAIGSMQKKEKTPSC